MKQAKDGMGKGSLTDKLILYENRKNIHTKSTHTPTTQPNAIYRSENREKQRKVAKSM